MTSLTINLTSLQAALNEGYNGFTIVSIKEVNISLSQASVHAATVSVVLKDDQTGEQELTVLYVFRSGAVGW